MMQKEKSKGLRRLSAIALAIAPVVALTVVNIPAVAAGLEKLDSKPLNDELQTVVEPIADNQAVAESNIVVESSDEATVNESPAVATNMEKQPSQSDSNNMLPARTADDKSESSSSNGKDVYTAVEEMAEFPGGMPGLMNFLSKTIRYPKEAFDANVQGRVIVKFVVNKDGSISDATVVKGVSKELDEEAIRVVTLMPKWTPGKAGGKAVSSYFTVPINFKLQVEKKAEEATVESHQ